MQITIAMLSEANKNERFDSQFFYPEYMDTFNKVINRKYSSIIDISHVTDGNHLKIAEDFDISNGVRYLRGQDLCSGMMLNDRNIVYIPENYFNSLKRSHIYKDDILVTIVGANTGLIGLVYEETKKLVASCKLGIIRAKKEKILSGYLYSFLISKYGQHQILRSIRCGGQTGLILPDMRNLKISRHSVEFEKRLNELVVYGHSMITESKKIYVKAQDILLSELGLTNWKPKHQLSFVRNFSETEEAGRMDAEYYQPKYDEIENAIKGYSGGYSFIKEEFRQNKKSFTNDKKQLYQYVEIGSVNITNGEITPDELAGEELPANAKILLLKDDIVISKVRTYRGAITIIEEDGYIGSGAFTVLQRKHGRINKETLLAFLHSKPILNWTLKPNTGTSYPVITDENILNMPVPLIPNLIQEKIRQKVSESFTLRRQSKHLLECAKRAVEIAIEQDEQTAIEWLEKETA
jgi:type I restriction enzyme S subunit